MLAFSSDVYLIKTTELQPLPFKPDIMPESGEVTLFLDAQNGDCLISGRDMVVTATAEYIPVRLAYVSFPKLKSFFINLLKKVKRAHYIESPSVYTVPLKCLYDNHVLRGERNAENAYALTNKRWQMSDEVRHKRWNDLYASIKTHGFDRKDPILVVLNRCLGVKDQLFQGHHRCGICKELGIKEVAVSFWAVHRSFSVFKLFVRNKV